MKFTSQVTVLGMKASKGTLDDGATYDSTKVYLLTDMDTSKGMAKGKSAAEYKLGTSVEFERFKALNFPFEATADMEIVSSGTRTQTVVHGLRPLKP